MSYVMMGGEAIRTKYDMNILDLSVVFDGNSIG